MQRPLRKEYFNKSSHKYLGLLREMLRYKPSERCHAHDAMKWSLFDEVRILVENDDPNYAMRDSITKKFMESYFLFVDDVMKRDADKK